MQSRISSCFQLDSQYIGLIRPLCSNGITRFHRSYNDPSQCSASDFSPCSFYYLSFYLYIETTGSHSSTQEPESDSRLLYAGRHLPSNQVSGKPFPRSPTSLGFDDNYRHHDASAKVHSRSSL